MIEFDRKDFDHIGVTVLEKPAAAIFVPATRVWVTNPRAHAGNVEWLYYEPDSPVTGPIRDLPHVAYRTQDLLGTLPKLDEVLLEPFDVGNGFVLAAFGLLRGIPVELMQYANPNETGWFE
jgi:hypothetical protein